MTDDEILAKIQQLESLKLQQPPTKFGSKYKITPKIAGFDIKPQETPGEDEAAKEKAKSDFKRSQLSKDLEPIMALEATIPRANGWARFGQGAKNQIRGFGQVDPIGRNIAAYQKGIDLFTPRIARTSGDTGNIAVSERGFSKNAFPTLYDDAGTAERKRQILKALGGGSMSADALTR